MFKNTWKLSLEPFCPFMLSTKVSCEKTSDRSFSLVISALSLLKWIISLCHWVLPQMSNWVQKIQTIPKGVRVREVRVQSWVAFVGLLMRTTNQKLHKNNPNKWKTDQTSLEQNALGGSLWEVSSVESKIWVARTQQIHQSRLYLTVGVTSWTHTRAWRFYCLVIFVAWGCHVVFFLSRWIPPLN